MRLANVVEALASVGEVDLFIAARPPDDPNRMDAAGGQVARLGKVMVTRYPTASQSWAKRVTWFLHRNLPLEVYLRDLGEVQQVFRRFVDSEYDLAWISRIENYVAFGSFLQCPTIVDLDDVTSVWLEGRFAARERDDPRSGPVANLKKRQTRRNVKLWTTLQARVSASVKEVVVCSTADKLKLRFDNARVVPNGYEPPAVPAGRLQVGSPPTILLQGSLTYAPNVDAARYFVSHVMPLLRERVPDTRVRLVGRASQDIVALHKPPRVVVTGAVPSIEAELRRADAIVAPLRFGGGTRIKVLEGFAHRIPVVTTTAGAFGLAAINEKHFLVADTAASFAEACIRLLTDVDVRRSLVDEAEKLFHESYEWGSIRRTVEQLALSP